MAEPTPVLPSEPAAGSAVYRPISGLAIAGLSISVLYAASVVVLTVFAWISGVPLLIPLLLLLPLAGAGISLAARVQINRSEGTRAGLPLANWGLLISLFFGPAYGAYIAATELAIRRQAMDFTDAWFAKLQKGEVHAAFLWCIDPAERKSESPDNVRRLRARYFMGAGGRKGPLPVFLEHEVPRLVAQAGLGARIESEGVREWEYLSGGTGKYLVKENYRITTAEGSFDVAIAIMSTENPKEGRREWQVVLNELNIKQRQLSGLGQGLAVLREESARFGARWWDKLARAQADEAFLDTLPLDQRVPVRRDQAARRFGQTLAAATVPDGLAGACLVALPLQMDRRLHFPGYVAFAAGQLVRTDDMEVSAAPLKTQIRNEVVGLFAAADRGTMPPFQFSAGYSRPLSPWKIENGEAQFTQPFELMTGTISRCEGTMTVATRDPEVVRQLQPVQLARTEAPIVSPGPGEGVAANPERVWRIVGIDLTVGMDRNQARPGMP